MFRSFFLSRRWFHWSVLGSLLIMGATWYSVQLDVQINAWQGTFFDLVQEALAKPGSVGRPLPGITLHVLGEDGHPLPPGEDKTEILRVVVRESMSLDLLDRLITDIFAVTESVMNSDEIDLAIWQPFQNKTTAEKKLGSTGAQSHEHHKHKRPMSKGVHRTVC